MHGIIKMWKYVKSYTLCLSEISQYVVYDSKRWGPTEGACLIAVPAVRTRPGTSARRMPSTYPDIRNVNYRWK